MRHPARAARAPLAVAVNGVVAAVTRVYSFPAFGHARPWEALVDPALLRPGANDVGVFAIGRGVFEGAIFGRWEQTFPLDACRLDSSTLEIELRSNVHVESSARARRLGVGVAAIELHAGGPAR